MTCAYNTFIYNEDVYGCVDTITSSFIAQNVILVQFPDSIVVNSSFYDISNYALAETDSGITLGVKQVLRFRDDRLSTNYLQIATDSAKEGIEYNLTVIGLLSVDGLGATFNSSLTYRKTKVDNIISSMPSHYDTRPDSTMRNILTAISLSDNLIGGSI